ncbi:MAG: hypothetical protein LBL51_05870 [Synergistaceae bacterium]|nr:hypothetical protein [Synergistaceae bacterium]
MKRRASLVPLFFLFFFCVCLCVPARTGADAAQPSRDRQEERERQRRLANALLLNIARLPADAGAEEKETLYLRVIEECPETESAQEVHWALSNLYLDGFGEPREEDAKKILEQFLARYPSSRWAVHVQSRLKWLNGEKEAFD